MQRIKYLFLAELFTAHRNKAHIRYTIASREVKDLSVTVADVSQKLFQYFDLAEISTPTLHTTENLPL
jgi:hypothetical protein